MGNLNLYIETVRRRSRRLRELFLSQSKEINPKELIAGLTVDERELFEKRARIMEFDGGLEREEAELRALREILSKNSKKEEEKWR